MSTVPVHPRHRAILSAFAAVLADPRAPRFGPTQDTLRELEAMALGEAGQGWDPMTPVLEDGQTLAQALVGAGGVDRAGWLVGWMERHGVASVFSGRGSCPLAKLMAHALQDLDEWQPMDLGRFQVLTVLVESAPGADLDEQALLAWRDGLALAGAVVARRGSQELLASLARAVERRRVGLVGGVDPVRGRGPDRWLDEREITGGLDEQVLAPSGRWRSLGELAGLRSVLAGGRTGDRGAPGAIPALPSAVNTLTDRVAWVAAGADLDEVRARAWAMIAGNPGAQARALLEGIEDGGPLPWGEEVALRLRQALARPDALGRGLASLLMTRRTTQCQEALEVARGMGLCPPQDARGAQGEGLIGQIVSGLRSAGGCDALVGAVLGGKGRAGAPRDWVGGNPGAWVDDLIDTLVPGQRMPDLVEGAIDWLEQAGEQHHAVRLGQALEFSLAGMHLSAVMRSKIDPGTDSYGRRAAAMELRPEALETLAGHVASHGVVLAVGRHEWRQWGRLGRDAAVAGVTAPKTLSAMATIQAGVEARELDMTLDAPARSGGPRARV